MQHAAEERYYAPLNSMSGVAEYSNSSSHIILGDDRQRKFAGLALAYQRRISARRWMVWDYSAEIRPLLFESDPTLDGQRITLTIDGKSKVYEERSPEQFPIENVKLYPDRTYSGTTLEGDSFTEVFHHELGRRWTYSPGVTPLCFSVHLLPAHRLQPFLASTAGFIVSTRDIPEFYTSAFNFTFSFGGGVQVFSRERSSFSLGYRYYHLSNANTGDRNPGVDANLFYAAFTLFKRH